MGNFWSLSAMSWVLLRIKLEHQKSHCPIWEEKHIYHGGLSAWSITFELIKVRALLCKISSRKPQWLNKTFNGPLSKWESLSLSMVSHISASMKKSFLPYTRKSVNQASVSFVTKSIGFLTNLNGIPILLQFDINLWVIIKLLYFS